MKTQGAFTVILNENGEVLLAKRRDYPIWDLPGGRMDKLESPVDCAIREAKEETGYDIKIVEKIGDYNRPEVGDLQHLFVGEIVGGKALVRSDETRALKFYPIKKLPFLMVPNRKRQIHDGINGIRNESYVLKEPKTIRDYYKAMVTSK